MSVGRESITRAVGISIAEIIEKHPQRGDFVGNEADKRNKNHSGDKPVQQQSGTEVNVSENGGGAEEPLASTHRGVCDGGHHWLEEAMD